MAVGPQDDAVAVVLEHLDGLNSEGLGLAYFGVGVLYDGAVKVYGNEETLAHGRLFEGVDDVAEFALRKGIDPTGIKLQLATGFVGDAEGGAFLLDGIDFFCRKGKFCRAALLPGRVQIEFLIVQDVAL